MDPDQNAPARVLDLCCGGKKCPILREFPDGSVSVADPDQASGAIRLSPEQAAAAAAWFASHASQRVPSATGAQRELHDAAP